MAVSLYTTEPGDHDVLLETGGVFRVSTLAAATHALVAAAGGNYDLVTLRGTVLSVVGGAAPGAPYVQLFAYAGGTVNASKLQSGDSTLIGT